MPSSESARASDSPAPQWLKIKRKTEKDKPFRLLRLRFSSGPDRNGRLSERGSSLLFGRSQDRTSIQPARNEMIDIEKLSDEELF